MTLVKRILMGLGSIALLALLMALVVPKARAVVATLVQVVNTASNPVPNLDTERNGRILYEATLVQPSCPAGYGCVFEFAVVPSGYRLHAENFNANVYSAQGATAPPAAILLDNTTTHQFFLSGVLGPALGQSSWLGSGLNQRITAYFNAGVQPMVQLYADWATGLPQAVTLTGYLEDCAVTGCPAVQN